MLSYKVSSSSRIPPRSSFNESQPISPECLNIILRPPGGWHGHYGRAGGTGSAKVEVIAPVAGQRRLWRVAGTNDSFGVTPTIFGPNMDGGYGGTGRHRGRRQRVTAMGPSLAARSRSGERPESTTLLVVRSRLGEGAVRKRTHHAPRLRM